MKVATTAPPELLPLVRARGADYLELIRPRVTLLVLFTVACGALLGSAGFPNPADLLHVLAGTALVAAGASALNQFLERQTDARMLRTENRPLPAGRLLPLEVLTFGVTAGAVGLAYLAIALRQPTAALVAAVTFATYVFLYTPLKRVTPLNTLVGAVPGALPPVIGWAALHGSIGWGGAALFLILFLWQVPHFLAIAWIYRDDYARAGMAMLPVVDRNGTRTGRQMILYCVVLIPASLLPAALGLAGPVYLVGATLLGCGFLASAVTFNRAGSIPQARRVLRASLVYLPALLALLLADGFATPVALALWP